MNMIGRRCRVARVSSGFEVPADFADMIGMEAERYQAIESGRAEPTVDEVAMIAHVTNRSIDVIVTGKTFAGAG